MDTRGFIIGLVLVAIALSLYSVRWVKREVSPRRRWILAILRALFLLALLALWYRPTVARTQTEKRPAHVAVIVDDSDSMTLQDAPGAGNQPMTRAQWIGSQILDPQTGLIALLNQGGAQVTLHAMSDARPLKNVMAYRPNQSRSDITRAIRELGAPERTSRPQAFVLVTDGADTESELPAERLPRDIPVYVIGVGDASPQVDLRIDDISFPSVVFRGEPVQGMVTAARQGGAPDPFRVKITVDGKEVESLDERFEEGAVRKAVAFSLQFDEIGDKTVVIDLSSDATEKVLRNNQETRMVSVLKEKRKIVGLFGAPSLETRFLLRALADDVRLQVQPIILLPAGKILDPSPALNKVNNRDDLWALISRADMVIAADLGDSGLTLDDAGRLYTYVNERGGSLLWIGGKRSFGPAIADSALGRLFPFAVPRKATATLDKYTIIVTESGAKSPGVEILNRAGTASLAPLSEVVEVSDLNPGSDVWLRAQPVGSLQDEGSEGAPLLVTQRYGLGRMAVFLGTGTWTWQMAYASLAESDLRSRLHTRFWQGIVNGFFMGTTSGDLRVETNGTVFEVHEGVTAWVQLDDQTAGWYQEPVLPAELIRPDGSSVRISLSRRSKEQPLYEEKFSLPQPGLYELKVEVGDRKGSKRLTARASGAEYAVLNQRVPVLQAIAGRTGGQYFSTQDWQNLPDALTLEPTRITRRSHLFMGQLPEVVILLLGMALAEWILRRRWALP